MRRLSGIFPLHGAAHRKSIQTFMAWMLSPLHYSVLFILLSAPIFFSAFHTCHESSPLPEPSTSRFYWECFLSGFWDLIPFLLPYGFPHFQACIFSSPRPTVPAYMPTFIFLLKIFPPTI